MSEQTGEARSGTPCPYHSTIENGMRLYLANHPCFTVYDQNSRSDPVTAHTPDGERVVSEQTGETVALTLRLEREMHERLRRHSFTLRRPISDLIREAIDRSHFHAADIWCDDCPPTYRVPPMDGTPPGAVTAHTPDEGGAS